MNELTWVEISKSALKSNIKLFRRILGDEQILAPCVKANAYGHGLVESSKIFLENGADFLSVNSLYEAQALRKAGIRAPIYVLGYISLDQIKDLVLLKDIHIVIYNTETVLKIAKELSKEKQSFKPSLHIKVETGIHRQGVAISELSSFVNLVKKNNLEVNGLSTHFANIEDTTDYTYGQLQFSRFKDAINSLEKDNIFPRYLHCSNSAATLLFKDMRLNMVRPGISSYGMWSSNETFLSIYKKNRKFQLSSALTWKSKIAQVKSVPSGSYIGYGCTFQTTHPSKIAIIPIGYYDGYPRTIKDAHVLINGKKAPVRGRVCMNIIMAEVTHIPDVNLEDEVVLLGAQGKENISTELFASWASTINYEITTRINDRIPRIYVN